MLKLQSLRDFLAQCAPDLARNPEDFIVYGDDGRLIATGTASLSFEYRYTAYATLLGYAGHPDAIMVPLLAWCQVNQPELFDNPAKRENAIRFGVAPQSASTYDLGIEIDLTERAIVTPDPGHDTRLRITHPDEPGAVGLQRFDGKDVRQLEVWELWMRDEKLATWEFLPPAWRQRMPL
ncbi:phage tail protein [Delftia acidovorans]|uniref:phage tail protein n=1 Tax=Delftia acidovorans TaxID=80866 RepID=UPI00242FFEB9|nr:phage tail protein [Delftia acidovorans]